MSADTAWFKTMGTLSSGRFSAPVAAAARTVLGKSRAGRRACPRLSCEIGRTRRRLDLPKAKGRTGLLPRNAVSGPAQKKNSGHGSNDVIPRSHPFGGLSPELFVARGDRRWSAAPKLAQSVTQEWPLLNQAADTRTSEERLDAAGAGDEGALAEREQAVSRQCQRRRFDPVAGLQGSDGLDSVRRGLAAEGGERRARTERQGA